MLCCMKPTLRPTGGWTMLLLNLCLDVSLLQGSQFDLELGLLSMLSFTCSPDVHVGFL